jgi:lipoprotein-anchoring transpeptidase ErfK/SrfK
VELVEEEDPLYLKNFVQLHPDNKMGWYLLGKQYEAVGKEGKAKYCFEQAGEVYNAFEMINGSDPAVEEAEETSRSKKAPLTIVIVKRRLFFTLRMITIAFVVVFMMTYLPKSAMETVQEDDTVYSRGVIENGLNVFYIQDASSSSELKEALHTMMTNIIEETKLSIIVKAPRSQDGQWIMWQDEPKALLSAQRTTDTGMVEVYYHDSQLCECTAIDGASALKTVKSWRQQQEQLVVLRSAMSSYTAMYGSLPATVDSLTRNYPQNLLSGFTDVMKKAYAFYTADGPKPEVKQPIPTATVQPKPQSTATSSGEVSLPTEQSNSRAALRSAPGLLSQQTKATPATASSASSENYAKVPPLTSPLEIVVDPETHQLALVSGKVIVRKYPVGLGGERTPKGSFLITEKVRHPNGHDDGDFGSRGMTLSNSLYAIHGTNQPSSMGEDVSKGCIRMLKEDIEELFDMTPIGTKVTIGKVNLPTQATQEKTRFHLPQLREESNPGRIYKWLN